MKPRLLGLLFALLAFVAAAQPAATVGSTTENNGLSRNGHFAVKTPSILRVGVAQSVPPNPRAAIAQYDYLLKLPADAATRADALRRGADLRVQLAEVDGLVNVPVLRTAIAQYQTLLKEQPDYKLNDRVLYQLARAQQAVGEVDLAINSLRALGDRYPASERAGDGVFRAAELLFQRTRYAEAELQYRRVVAIGAINPLFVPAQYKLGWSLVKQGKHEQALPVFFAILDRDLPPGALDDPDAALAAVAKNRSDITTEVLRITSLSLAALGSGKNINAYFEKTGGEPRFATLIYVALAKQLLEKQQFTDAADINLAFVERHPKYPRAPEFQSRAIGIYEVNGYVELAVAAKEAYVTRYTPAAGQPPASSTVMAELKRHLGDLGRYYQARAQATSATETAQRNADFLKAADWYRRTLQLFPNDADVAALDLLYADALYDAGQTRAAALQYEHAAYDSPSQPKRAEAAYAAVQAWQSLAASTAPDARDDVLKQSVRASRRLVDGFPDHPQWALVISRAADNLIALHDNKQALQLASRMLASPKPAAPALRSAMLGVVADARFGQRDYAAAEVAYGELLKLLDSDDAQRATASERMAKSIYEQAVVARNAGNLRLAAQTFTRVGVSVPQASIRAAAEYDAASALMTLGDWPGAQVSLEGFQQRFPDHALATDADRKLAQAYEKDKKLSAAAAVYARLSERSSLSPDMRRDASLLSAQSYERGGNALAASKAYETYLDRYPQPQEVAQVARRHLADLARNSRQDQARYLYWLRELVAAGDSATVARDASTRQMAAQASLEIGQISAANARLVRLSLPVEVSLAQRRSAIEAAVSMLDRAAGYGFADVTTAATYELGTVYRDFSRALLQSERPLALSADALAEYNLLLEEQANPFEEKAMKAYEANLQRLRQGVWDQWIRKSSLALSELAPGKYGKKERLEERYDAIH